MGKLFNVNILLPNKTIFSGKISSLIVPAELGYLGVLADHAPLLSNLIPGKITFKNAQGLPTIIHSKAKGFLEVLHNEVTILLDSAD